MAIKRIDDFPSGSGSLTGDDLFLVMDDPSGFGITKNISLNNLIEVIGSGGSSSELTQGNSSTIDGSINNYNPGVTTDTVRMSGINTPILTGLSYTNYSNDAGLFINVGPTAITIKHNDSNSDADNRFLVPWAGDYVASPSGGAFLAVRDKTDNIWWIV